MNKHHVHLHSYLINEHWHVHLCSCKLKKIKNDKYSICWCRCKILAGAGKFWIKYVLWFVDSDPVSTQHGKLDFSASSNMFTLEGPKKKIKNQANMDSSHRSVTLQCKYCYYLWKGGCFHLCVFVCWFVSRITQKLPAGFPPNLDGRSVSAQNRPH